jgi:multiple sugar transport system ATP-binding protein
MSDLELRGVCKSFGETEVLHDIDLKVEDGEFVVFVGPSGCGKSTLLRIIAGLEEVTAGELKIDGAVVNAASPAERGVAMVFQSYALYPHMTVYENMAFCLRLAHRRRAEIDAAVGDAARILAIDHLLGRKPGALSGGQRQRVAIGRAIVREPKIFLFDEPLSNLDAALRVRMRYEFAKLHQDLKTTMVYVTHDQVEAMTLADRIVVLSAGRVEQIGAPMTLYQHPDNLFVAGFIGSPKINLIAAVVEQGDAEHADVRLTSGESLRVEVDATSARIGDLVTVGIRSESFDTLGDVNAIDAKVKFVESLGSATFAYAALDGADEDLTIQLPGEAKVVPGEMLRLSAPPHACHLFDASGRAFRRLSRPPDTLAA